MTGSARPGRAMGPGLAWLGLWLAGSLVLLSFFHDTIAARLFGDPDDLLRLQEVRDWLGGQSWFDVTQYRLNPPGGAAMHWSRLVDVPLAAVILALRPFLGQPVAETVAAVAVPLLTYGAIVALMLAIADRLAGRPAALVTGAFAAFNFGTFSIARPMRIDHHGWQAVCALVIVWALLCRRHGRGAAAAGLAAAVWAQISLEALPFTAAAAGLIALRWLIAPVAERRDEGRRLVAFLITLAVAGGGLFLLAHGGGLIDRTFCDAVSPIHLLLFAGAAAGVAGLVAAAPAALWARLGGLGLIGAACLVVYRTGAPQCAGGPFAQLDPLLYRLWYLHVLEGLPIWKQPPAQMAVALAYPMIGLAGAWRGWTVARDAAERRDQLDYALLLAAATGIGVMVLRASAFANLLALPGGAVVTIHAVRHMRASRSLLIRVFGAVAVILLTTPFTLPLLVGLGDSLRQPDRADRQEARDRRILRCIGLDNLAHLDALPPAIIFAQLNVAPAVVVASHHTLIASGHHRAAPAMLDVVRFFTGPVSEARAIVRARHARYVLICPGEGEMRSYARFAPRGLAPSLQKGMAPPWLIPIRVPGLREARLWRVAG